MNTVKRSKFTKKNKTKSEVCSNLLEGNFVIGFLLTYSACTSGILNVGRVFVGEIDEHSEKITEGTSSKHNFRCVPDLVQNFKQGYFQEFYSMGNSFLILKAPGPQNGETHCLSVFDHFMGVVT